MESIKAFLKLVKFEHSIFALPFAYLGLFLAEDGRPRLQVFFWVTVAMIALRTSAMCLNRLIDEPIDEKNPRTRDRIELIHLLSRWRLWLAAGGSAAIFILASAQLNLWCLALAPIPVVLVAVYPHLKKFTWLSHFVLGLILGMAPYGGWLASRTEWSWIPLILTLAVASWVSGFDMFYALHDVGFDRAYRLKSFPARFGTVPTLIVAAALHGMTLALLAYLGALMGFGAWYWAGWAAIFGLILREHFLVFRFGLARVNEAFFNMNAWVSVVIFLAAAFDLIMRHRPL